MSDALKNSSGWIGTVSELSKYAEELSGLIAGKTPEVLTHTDTSIEDPSVFALEKHLEDFLVANWNQTELAKNYDIFEEDGELVGQQYPSDTGPLDILAVSKDKRTLLVVELKKGRASDAVVGQIQRYMGYVKEELAEPGQDVKGVIIALDEDLRLKRALSVTNNIDFYSYKVSFSLIKGGWQNNNKNWGFRSFFEVSKHLILWEVFFWLGILGLYLEYVFWLSHNVSHILCFLRIMCWKLKDNGGHLVASEIFYKSLI